MRAFDYVAYTARGQRRSGSIVAETEADAADQLARRDLFASDIHPARAAAGKGARGGRRLSADLQAVFTRQMAVLLGAELPAEAALEAAGRGASAALVGVSARARAALLDGATLSDALALSGAGFPPYYLAALRAGETAGELASVLTELADHLDRIGTDRAQIIGALIYPAFVAAVSVVVCAILMVSVAPEIVSIFETSGRPLPDLTQAVLAVSDWIGAHLVLIGIAFGALALLGGLSSRVAALRDRRDRIALRLPLAGRLKRLSASVQYLRTLALVLGSRHAVLAAADSAVEVLTVARFRAEGEAVALAVRQGEALSSALERLSFLPPVARQLIQAGESSVRLARMTERAATLVEHRLSSERKRIAALLEPMLMMLVGALVLVIVLAVLLPIFDLQAVVAG